MSRSSVKVITLKQFSFFCQHNLASTDQNGNKRVENSKLIAALDTLEWTL